MDGSCRGNAHRGATSRLARRRACSVAALLESAPSDGVLFHAAISRVQESACLLHPEDLLGKRARSGPLGIYRQRYFDVLA